jgi:hypothetical protein
MQFRILKLANQYTGKFKEHSKQVQNRFVDVDAELYCAVALYFATYAHYLNEDSVAYQDAYPEDQELKLFFSRQRAYYQ